MGFQINNSASSATSSGKVYLFNIFIVGLPAIAGVLAVDSDPAIAGVLAVDSDPAVAGVLAVNSDPAIAGLLAVDSDPAVADPMLLLATLICHDMYDMQDISMTAILQNIGIEWAWVGVGHEHGRDMA